MGTQRPDLQTYSNQNFLNIAIDELDMFSKWIYKQIIKTFDIDNFVPTHGQPEVAQRKYN